MGLRQPGASHGHSGFPISSSHKVTRSFLIPMVGCHQLKNDSPTPVPLPSLLPCFLYGNTKTCRKLCKLGIFSFVEVVTPFLLFLSFFLVAFPYFLFYVYFIFLLSDAYCSNLFSSQQICRLCSGCLCFRGGRDTVSFPATFIPGLGFQPASFPSLPLPEFGWAPRCGMFSWQRFFSLPHHTWFQFDGFVFQD